MTASPTSALEKWLDQFLSYQNLPQKKDFWLDTMHFLCERFGHPEKCAPCIHVAGSKGKGSVTEMVASVIEEYGYKCGLCQSPHISDFRERVKLAHDFFPDEIYLEATNEMIKGIEAIANSELPNGRPVTWFELITLYAFLCFRLAKVDFAVYEVGLGGKLDATNVVMPELCLITQIELEHTEFLGDTIEKVAAEKAGIIKPNVPVIIGRQTDKNVYDIVEKVAKSVGSECKKIDDFIENIKQTPFTTKNIVNMSEKSYYFPIKTPLTVTPDNRFSVKKYEKIYIKSQLFARDVSTNLRLLGNVQAENAVLAAVAAKKTIPQISESVIEKGLSKAFLPGRFEICDVHLSDGKPLARPVTIILDGAHTVTSIKNTIQTLRDFFPDDKYHALFACAKDKDVVHIAPLFKNDFAHITITKPGNAKATDTNAVCGAFKSEKINFEFYDETKTALKNALSCASGQNAVLLVVGSFYLVAEASTYLQ